MFLNLLTRWQQRLWCKRG